MSQLSQLLNDFCDQYKNLNKLTTFNEESNNILTSRIDFFVEYFDKLQNSLTLIDIINDVCFLELQNFIQTMIYEFFYFLLIYRNQTNYTIVELYYIRIIDVLENLKNNYYLLTRDYLEKIIIHFNVLSSDTDISINKMISNVIIILLDAGMPLQFNTFDALKYKNLLPEINNFQKINELFYWQRQK